MTFFGLATLALSLTAQDSGSCSQPETIFSVDQELIIGYQGKINSGPKLSVGIGNYNCIIGPDFIESLHLGYFEFIRLLERREASLECARTEDNQYRAVEFRYISKVAPHKN